MRFTRAICASVAQGGKYVQYNANPPVFRSSREHITHDHYVKVVPTVYKQLGKPAPTKLYEYTISSNAYALEPPFMTSGEAHDGPIIKLSYDLSPLQARARAGRSSRARPY